MVSDSCLDVDTLFWIYVIACVVLAMKNNLRRVFLVWGFKGRGAVQCVRTSSWIKQDAMLFWKQQIVQFVTDINLFTPQAVNTLLVYFLQNS